jgi:hypothetical protein
MEHRYSQRVPMRLLATLHKWDGDEINATILNLSEGGAYVALPVGCPRLRGLIELEPVPDLRLLTGSSPQPSLWRAYVIHQGAESAGLMFDDTQISERLSFLAAHVPWIRKGRVSPYLQL